MPKLLPDFTPASEALAPIQQALASVGPNNRLPERCVLEKFPKSQHQLLLITPPTKVALSMPSMPISDETFARPNGITLL